MSNTPASWKSEQREILRAAFAPAFLKYSELVNKIHEPDDWRKYLEFIARQTGLEEPTAKGSAHDGLATVNINIGNFRGTAMPMNMTMATGMARELLTAEDVAALPVEDEPPQEMDPPMAMPMFDPMVAKMLAADVLDAEPPRLNDFEGALDALGV